MRLRRLIGVGSREGVSMGQDQTQQGEEHEPRMRHRGYDNTKIKKWKISYLKR